MDTIQEENINTLTEQVELATQELGKIKTQKELLAGIRKEMTEHILNAFKESKIDLTKDQKKIVKSLFNKIIKTQTEKDTEDNGVVKKGFLTKKIEDIILLTYTLNYLGIKDLENIFAEYGITLSFNSIENKLRYLDCDSVKDTLKEFVNEAVNINNNSTNIQHKIEDNIYNEIPATLKYHKESNPSGITKNTFKKFSFLNLLKKIAPGKAKEKCNKLEEETDAKNRANVFALSYLLSLVKEK